MTKKKKSNYVIKLIIVGILIILILVIISLRKTQEKSFKDNTDSRFNSSMKKSLSTISPINTSQNELDQRYIPITPTLIPSSANNWNTFIFPKENKKFTFDVPATWEISLLRDKYALDNEIKLSVYYKENDVAYGLFFMQGGRGSPYYENDKNEKRSYDGRNAKIHTLYLNDKPFEAFISFDEAKSDPFVGIDIKIPSENTENFLQIVEKILLSLKFFY